MKNLWGHIHITLIIPIVLGLIFVGIDFFLNFLQMLSVVLSANSYNVWQWKIQFY
jgi:hypothetical protein